MPCSGNNAYKTAQTVYVIVTVSARVTPALQGFVFISILLSFLYCIPRLNGHEDRRPQGRLLPSLSEQPSEPLERLRPLYFFRGGLPSSPCPSSDPFPSSSIPSSAAARG